MSRIIRTEEGEIYDIELAENLLKTNKDLVLENRKLLNKQNVKATDVMASIGTGKTSLIGQSTRTKEER